MRIVIMGDFGSRDKIGSPEGLDESISFLNHITSPMRPIMGNHVDGTRFFTNGVHGDRTRDTQRQSRLLELLRYDEAARSMEHLGSDVFAWDSWKGQEALIAAGEDGIPIIESNDGLSSCSLVLPGYLIPAGEAPLPFLCLGDHRVVFIAGKTAYYVSQ
jgi:hypothetical protein